MDGARVDGGQSAQVERALRVDNHKSVQNAPPVAMLSGFSLYPAAPNVRRLAARGYGKSRRACRTRNCVAMLLKAEAWHSGVVPEVPASARVGGCGSDRKGDTNTNRKDLDERASFAVLPCYCSISHGADRVNVICERRIIGAGTPDGRRGIGSRFQRRHCPPQWVGGAAWRLTISDLTFHCQK